MKKGFFILVLIGLAAVIAVTLFPGGGTAPGPDDGTSSSDGSVGSAATSARPRGRELSCSDGADNEADGLTDCDDPDCSGDLGCRCQALSCGAGGGASCQPEAGCICDATDACIPCKREDQVCGSDADCCQGMSLHCQEFLVSGSKREKRCAPISERVCDIECTGSGGAGEGRWGKATNCAAGVAPPGAEDCARLTGTCDPAPGSDQRIIKCWES